MLTLSSYLIDIMAEIEKNKGMRKKTALQYMPLAVLAVVIVLTGCKSVSPNSPSGSKSEGISPGKDPATLTLYSSEQVTLTNTPAGAGNKKITWTSSDPTVASVDENGKITATGVTDSLTEKYTVIPATGTAVITGTTEEGKTTSITVNTTVKPQTATVDSVPAMKDQFKNYFMMGNIAGGANDINGTGATATRLKRHYNILTAENVMKPGSLTNFRDASTGVINYAWTTNPNNSTDSFVNACTTNGFKVHGHTLLWHNQNPQWMWEQIAGKTGTIASGMDKTKALTIMREYITEVMTHFKGKVYSWDVLNEAFPDNASSSANWKDAIRKGARGEGQDANPWYIAIGSDFVYEGFLAARKADPGAILYYNDYNTDNFTRAMLIHDMVKEVNDKYLALPSGSKPSGDPAGRLLIEGIGMQEHHNTGVTANAIMNTITLFRPLGVKISVSELDVLGQTWSQYDSNKAGNSIQNSTVTNQGLLDQARLYGEYMKLYIENSDIIERVSLWGLTDNRSWRAKGLPLLFDETGKAKPAYFKMIAALGQ
jgi:endo-1,4-beta-xylanase